jgi:hypothetical protein
MPKINQRFSDIDWPFEIGMIILYMRTRTQKILEQLQSFLYFLTFIVAMAEWLCCLAGTAKVLCSNFDATRHGMALDKSLTTVCLGSPGRCMLITCNIRRPLRLVSVYEALKWLSGGTLFQVCLLSRATASNRCRKNIGFPGSTLYRKAGYSYFLELYEKKKI